MLEQLQQIRDEGFAYDFEEHLLGVGAVAVGLQTPQGHYAIDVVGPIWRVRDQLETIKAALLACQVALNKALRSID
ncbi:IclR family transcriptional regulator C-terminal domain-containing protein [Pseudomonas sp. NA-150]|uniref:IclR family transcriptional regulator domain-containing protein n=1 Tax=Pseudomonas sp. NA-150 TaxID=3367525 RepID=UPI0037C577BA